MLRGFSRSIAEIEWLLRVLVILYLFFAERRAVAA